ncbi:hypothetical protein [Pontibaca salina]|uniref:Uncharacterized protein n=1 Tax=Pontibaca salina TaxID=2795731 RepID=A0A934LYT6_9RHOB|nr:hypothetical protein [Pontibaca salina]MBI6628270.1 hypothetical protein [Pontibaca salina]
MKIVLLMYSDEARENLVKVEKLHGLPEGTDTLEEGRESGSLSEGVLDAQTEHPIFYRIARMDSADIPKGPSTSWVGAI